VALLSCRDRHAWILIVTVSPVRFVLKFVLGFALLVTVFEASRGSHFERFVVERLILTPTAMVINLVTPTDQVEPVGRTLVSPGRSRLHVVRGCEGIEMLLLLAAAIAAIPASFRHRLQGLLLGAALAYALSVGRLVALHYVLQYQPGAWEAMHGLILPVAPILVLALFFTGWLQAAPSASNVGQGHAAA
jgi:exosortase family protein XrtM